MSEKKIDKTSTFADELAAQDKIQGRFISGHRFTCSVQLVGKDFFYAKDLQMDDLHDSGGDFRDEDGANNKSIPFSSILTFCPVK